MAERRGDKLNKYSSNCCGYFDFILKERLSYMTFVST